MIARPLISLVARLFLVSLMSFSQLTGEISKPDVNAEESIEGDPNLPDISPEERLSSSVRVWSRKVRKPEDPVAHLNEEIFLREKETIKPSLKLSGKEGVWKKERVRIGAPLIAEIETPPAEAAPAQTPAAQEAVPDEDTPEKFIPDELPPVEPPQEETIWRRREEAPLPEPVETPPAATIWKRTPPPPPAAPEIKSEEPAPVFLQKEEPTPSEAAPPSPPPPPPSPEGEPTFFVKFTNVSMGEFIRYVSQFTGRNFIFDPADLDFNVTVISNEPMNRENIMAAVLQELRIHDLEMVQVGNNIIIHKNSAVKAPGVVESGDQPSADKQDIVTQVFRLYNADPETLATIIKPMLSETSIVEAIPASRHLIVTSIRTNIERIADLIKKVDTPQMTLQFAEYQAINLPVLNLIQVAKDILQPIAGDRPFVLSSLTQKNTVYIASTPSLVSQSLRVLRQIDRGEQAAEALEKLTPSELERLSEEEKRRLLEEERAQIQTARGGGNVTANRTTKFYLHKLQYRKGDQIQQALNAVAQSLQEIQTEQDENDLISAINSVQWIESTNSLVFTGTPEVLQQIKELIDEIDTALPQVLIEILVLEADLEDTLSFGVDWATRFSEPTMAGAQGFLTGGTSLAAAIGSGVPGSSNIDASGLISRSGFNLGIIGRTICRGGCDFNSIGALVSALHADRRIDILLNPKIVVEDNTPAEFFVGINTPFQTSSIANDFGTTITSNFEFRDIGQTVKVTPIIGNNGIVTLDIEQEISALASLNFNVSNGSASVTGTNAANINGITGGIANGSTSGLFTNSSSTPLVPQTASNIGPTTRKSTTKTRVHLPDGYFLILSGQIRDEKEEIRTQVPCLGGLPIIGGAFSTKITSLDKKNLMLFIRPQIVDIERINPITKRQQDIWDERKRIHKRWEYEVDEALDFFNIRECYGTPEERKLRE